MVYSARDPLGIKWSSQRLPPQSVVGPDTHTCLEGFKETGRSFFAFRARRTARCNCKSALPLTRISQPCLPALLEDLTPADPGLDLKVAFNGLCVRLNSSFSREDSKAADLMQED